MSVIAYPPSSPAFADGTPIPGPCAITAFRTAANSYVAGAEGMAQLAQGALEALHTLAFTGALSGGAIAAGTGLSVTVAALTAFCGQMVGTDAATTVGALTDDATTRIWLRQDGTFSVTANDTAPTGDGHGLALRWGTATAVSGSVTAVSNDRQWVQLPGIATITAAADSDLTLTAAQHTRQVLKLGSLGWSTDRNVIVPNWPSGGAIWWVLNGTGHAATVKTSAGTGIAVANGKAAALLGDGTNVVRLTADV